MARHTGDKRAGNWKLYGAIAVLVLLSALAPPSSALAARKPRLTWKLPHTASEGASVRFSWAGSHLGRNHKLVIQKPEGTAHTWRTILRLNGNSGSAELPSLALGKYRFRIADLSGRRVLAQQVAGIAMFGQVPFTRLFGENDAGVLATPTNSFPYVAHWQDDPQPAFKVEDNHCLSVHIAFVASEYHAHGTAAITLVQESRDPVSASAPFESIGSLDAELVLGQSWAVNILSKLEAEEYYTYINGYAVCDSTEPFSS